VNLTRAKEKNVNLWLKNQIVTKVTSDDSGHISVQILEPDFFY